MDDIGDQLFKPVVLERRRGGFLAVSGSGLPVRIGVIADSAEDAQRRFADLVAGWLRDRANEASHQATR